MSMKLSTKDVKFMAPGPGTQALGWGQYGHVVKMHKILENLLLYSGTHIYLRKTICIIVMFMKL